MGRPQRGADVLGLRGTGLEVVQAHGTTTALRCTCCTRGGGHAGQRHGRKDANSGPVSLCRLQPLYASKRCFQAHVPAEACAEFASAYTPLEAVATSSAMRTADRAFTRMLVTVYGCEGICDGFGVLEGW